MRRGLGLGTLGLVLGCTPAAQNDPAAKALPIASSDVADPAESEAARGTPHLALGQTWEVDLRGFQFSMRLDHPGRAVTERWLYEVVDIDEAGVATIAIRMADEDGTPSDRERWWMLVHTSGLLIRVYQEGYYPPFAHHGRPFVPFVASRGATTTPIPPWWPTFPLVPGQKLSFMDGAITQSVREVDGLLEVELVANPPAGERGPWRGVTMYWERGRPFWSKIDVVYVPPSGIPITQYEYRGEVVSWDRSHPSPP